MTFLSTVIKRILQFLISGLRPLLGPASCKYPVGCTQFALDQLEQEPLYKAVPAIIKRVLSCAPWW